MNRELTSWAEDPVRTGPKDTDLLRLLSAGDERAMAMLFDRYGRVIYSVSLRVLRDPESAELVLHEVLMEVWRNPESFAVSGESLGGWLALLARSWSLSTLHRSPPPKAEAIELSLPCDLADGAARQGLFDLGRAGLSPVPRSARKALEMAFFDGLTNAEIAEMTGLPAEKVKAGIRSALFALREAAQA